MTRLRLNIDNCQLQLGVYLNGRCVHLTAHRGGRWLAAVTNINGSTRKFELTEAEARRLKAVAYSYEGRDANSVAACICVLERMGYPVYGEYVREED